jgi:flagella basal body P-ring formation protein FlgA
MSFEMMPAKRLRIAAVLTFGLLSLFAATQASTAEIQLKAQADTTAAVVRLSDVAEIFSNEQQELEQLGSVELFPTPSIGAKRFVRLREIQELLASHGINLTEHTFSGASQVAVATADAPKEKKPLSERRTLAPQADRAEKAIEATIVHYLEEQVAEAADWKVSVGLEAEQTGELPQAAKPVSVQGGASPWIGEQRFDVTFASPQGPRQVSVKAHVSLPPAIVVCRQAVARGTVLCEADVTLQQVDASQVTQELCSALEDVLGKQTTRALQPGQPLVKGDVRSPLLVQRGEVVTIYSRAAGVQIRTAGRARDEGSLGDLVTIESLSDRKTFFARVSGIQEAEVFASAATAQGAPIGNVAPLESYRQHDSRPNLPLSLKMIREPAPTAAAAAIPATAR